MPKPKDQSSKPKRAAKQGAKAVSKGRKAASGASRSSKSKPVLMNQSQRRQLKQLGIDVRPARDVDNPGTPNPKKPKTGGSRY